LKGQIKMIRVKEVDDLDLVPCPVRRRPGQDHRGCLGCRGTGDQVVHRVKYYMVAPKGRREKREAL